MRQILRLIAPAFILIAGGCAYFDFQYHPTGYSSTYHKYETEERVRQWHARRAKVKKLAALRKKVADNAAKKQDAKPKAVAQQQPDSAVASQTSAKQ